MILKRACFGSFLFAMLVLISVVVAQPATQPSTRPAGASMPRDPSLPTLWLVGDSTMSNHANGGLGWGDPFIPMFDKSKVNVVNRGIGGRSSRSFQVEGRWDAVLRDSKPGDFVILQMGHNDGGDIKNPNGRPSLAGLGEESEEITRSDGRKETVHTFGWYMRKYVTDAKAKGLTIIICSSVPHMPREAIKEGETETRFKQVAWAEEVAKSENVPFINVNKIVSSHYVGMDPADIKTKYFTPPADGTHTNPEGAALHARCVVEGIKTLTDLSLKDFLAN
jgi:lysophospholipase L1-like esterase